MGKIKFIGYSVTGLLAAVSLMLSSCGSDGGKKDFNNSGGKPYEIVVAIADDQWNGEVGDTLRSIFLEPIAMFNQVEPHFDISRVVPGGLKDIILRHRNILVIKINPEVKEPASVARYDVYARPQIIVTLTAPDNNAMVRYLIDNRVELQRLFEITERDRSVSNNKSFGEKGIDKEVRKMFGIDINIPKGFQIRNTVNGDFMWIGNEVRLATQGLVIYSYPYKGKDDFRLENLIKRRNEFMKRIPGPSDGSYMTTGDYIEPVVTYSVVKGLQWAEMRGFWDIENDFMGGPFVNYSTVDKATGRVVSIDCFVYSPKDPKRNLMRQLEHVAYSVGFPSADK